MIQRQNVFLSRIYRKHRIVNEDEYPYSIPAIRDLESLDFNKSVTYIVGPNGSGKSTILEAIAVLMRLNPEGGSRNMNFHTVETHSELFEDLVAARADTSYRDAFFFRAESFYNVQSEIDRIARYDRSMYNSYGGKSLHQRSHGEGFMSLIENRLTGRGFYLFDEPEAALYFQNQLIFLCWMKKAVSQGAQIIITTHSPVVLSYPDADIYEIEDGTIKQKAYEESIVFRDMYGFMLNRELYLREMGL